MGESKRRKPRSCLQNFSRFWELESGERESLRFSLGKLWVTLVGIVGGYGESVAVSSGGKDGGF